MGGGRDPYTHVNLDMCVSDCVCRFLCGAEYDILGVVQHTGTYAHAYADTQMCSFIDPFASVCLCLCRVHAGVSQGGHCVAYDKRNSKVGWKAPPSHPNTCS